jgi:hypothetical protein
MTILLTAFATASAFKMAFSSKVCPVIATHNQGKVKEFKEILEPKGYSVSSLAEIGFTGCPPINRSRLQ